MHSDDPEEVEYASSLVALFTPIVKAHFTDVACETASTCMQVMGGAGYCTEYAVEQFYRDVRISKIWEGTNGVQALDLAGRKITQNMGKNLRHLMWPLTEFIEENRDIPEMLEFNKPLHQGARTQHHSTMIAEGQANLISWRQVLQTIVGILEMFCWPTWAKMAKKAMEKKGDPFYDAKIASARFFFKEYTQRQQPWHENSVRT